MNDYEDAILPDDFEAEPQADETQEETLDETVSEEVDTTETEQTEESQDDTEGMTEAEKKAFLKIKYNKEEVELDEEKAKELAQKGMNYDKLQEKLQSLENDPRLKFIEELAKENNMTVEQFLEAAEQQREQEKIKQLAEREQVSEEIARRLYELEKRDQERSNREKKQQEEMTKKEQQEKDFQAFLETYPDVKPEDIPLEVWQQVEQGKSLVDAYARHENNKLKEQLKILKQNQENVKKATGPVTEHGSDEQKAEDDFLKGFNSI